MDPRTEKAEKLAQAIESRISRERVSLVRGDSSHPFWCSDIIVEALLSVPAPSPSTDARAKLEQAHARWKAAKEADYAEPTVRTRLALEAAEHNLFHLALPPPVAQTPQPTALDEAIATIRQPAGQDGPQLVSHGWVKRKPKVDPSRGETPQPAPVVTQGAEPQNVEEQPLTAAEQDRARAAATDIALHGWPKETGGAQTPAAARRLKHAWLKAGPK